MNKEALQKAEIKKDQMAMVRVDVIATKTHSVNYQFIETKVWQTMRERKITI